MTSIIKGIGINNHVRFKKQPDRLGVILNVSYSSCGKRYRVYWFDDRKETMEFQRNLIKVETTGENIT